MEYWNPYLETLAREELERVELAYFRKIVSYGKERSRLYRDKLKGIAPQDLRTLEDIRKIPLTDKEELRQYQEMEPFPYGGILGVGIEQVTTFRQTSGTTGKPVVAPYTQNDIDTWAELMARSSMVDALTTAMMLHRELSLPT